MTLPKCTDLNDIKQPGNYTIDPDTKNLPVTPCEVQLICVWFEDSNSLANTIQYVKFSDRKVIKRIFRSGGVHSNWVEIKLPINAGE